MRKVIVSMNVTLDGFISGMDCSLDWHFQRWNAEMGQLLTEHLSQADTILLGRVTYQVMAKHWPSVVINLSYPAENIAFASMMNSHHKIVFSNTLTHPEWNNSRLMQGDIADEIVQLKQQPGKDMIVYGSGRFVAALNRLGLVDEYHIWVHPVLLGKGKPLFKSLRDKQKLKLVQTKTFRSGVVLLYYTCAQ